MAITVSQGKKTLLTTVSVVMISGEPVDIKIEPDIIIQIAFVEDKNEKNFISFSIENECLKVKLQNFNNPLGSSTRTPIEIGDINGKKLFMHFIVHAIGNENEKIRLLNCSFFTENVID